MARPDAPSRGLYIYAVAVCKQGVGQTLTSLVQGYRVASNEDEVRGIAVQAAMESKPGFNISDVLVLRVSDAAIELANPEPRRLEGKDAGAANRGAEANATGTGRHDGGGS